VNKLRGGSHSPLTRLKGLVQSDAATLLEIWLWNKDLITSAAIRERIKRRFGIELKRDSHVSQFWGWLSLLVAERNQFDGATFNEALRMTSRRRQARWILTGKVSKSNREEEQAERRRQREFNVFFKVNKKGQIKRRNNRKLRAG
jgi:hypothetical protein